MNEFTYCNPVKIIFGENQRSEVIQEIKRYGNRVLVILGGESFEKNGNYAPLMAVFQEKGLDCCEIKGNRTPSLEVVRQGIRLCREKEIDFVLGIRGGACMDIAETIAFGVKQPFDIWEYLSGAKEAGSMEHLPVATIPTFPSSGSDMNGSTQITNDETREQAGLSGVYPNFTWLNPAYIRTLSVSALTEGQITAFVQLSMAYLGLERSEIAEQIVLVLMETIIRNLRKLKKESSDETARANLMLAGALNVCGLTFMGKNGDWSLYPLEGIAQEYCGVGYKQAISILFPYWLKQVYGGQQVFKDYFSYVFGVDCKEKSDEEVLEAGTGAILSLSREFGFPTSFKEVTASLDSKEILREKIAAVGEQPSIYTYFTLDKIEEMMMEAINGRENRA